MNDNHLYNLMSQIVEEQRSLWRIQTSYLEDAGDCADCQDFWARMIADKEAYIEELNQLIRSHME